MLRAEALLLSAARGKEKTPPPAPCVLLLPGPLLGVKEERLGLSLWV